MPHDAHVCVCTCARVCVRAHVCASVIREIKHRFQDNSISLNHSYVKYTSNSLIYVMCNYLFVLIYVGDVALRGALITCIYNLNSYLI